MPLFLQIFISHADILIKVIIEYNSENLLNVQIVISQKK